MYSDSMRARALYSYASIQALIMQFTRRTGHVQQLTVLALCITRVSESCVIVDFGIFTAENSKAGCCLLIMCVDFDLPILLHVYTRLGTD